MTDKDNRVGDLHEDLRRYAGSHGRASPKSPVEALQPEQVPPPPQRSRAVRHPAVIFLNSVLTIVVLVVLAVGGGIYMIRSQFNQEGPLSQERAVVVQQGAGLSDIADQLVREGIVSSSLMFSAGVWLNRQQTNLRAGEYLVDARASMREVMEALTSGRSIQHWVTVPEGRTSHEIVQMIRNEPKLEGNITAVPAEGSLLPETYPFARGDTRQALIDRMRRDFDSAVEQVWERRASDLPLASPEELVILASIVEKETALADERSRVAAVFINRIRLGMRLQTDPTVIYGLFGGEGKPADFALTRAHLDSQTPYNTYVIDGLPPGPIANPGRASLEAVANPSRTDDLYFVADGTGGHAFASTYEEHLRNVANWRRIRDGGTAAN